MDAQDAIRQSVAPTTTLQQDLTHAGQRRVNLIWEVTQAIIAIAVVLANVYACVVMVTHKDAAREYPIVLSSMGFLIVGFYFSRTNHAAIGGTGAKPVDEYTGR